MEIKKRYDWENPAVIKRNKEDGHVIAFSYDNALDAAERKESPYKVTLNGKWKFHWQMGIDNCPPDFYEPSFDDSDWRYITVPSVGKRRVRAVLRITMQVPFRGLSAVKRAKSPALITICRKSVFTDAHLPYPKTSTEKKYFYTSAQPNPQSRYI